MTHEISSVTQIVRNTRLDMAKKALEELGFFNLKKENIYAYLEAERLTLHYKRRDFEASITLHEKVDNSSVWRAYRKLQTAID